MVDRLLAKLLGKTCWILVFDRQFRNVISTTLAKCQIWNRNSSSFQKVLSSPHVFHFYFKKKFDPYLSSDFRTQFLFLYLFRIPFLNVKMTNTNKSRKGLAKSLHKSQPYSKNITSELCFLGLLAGLVLKINFVFSYTRK